MRKLMSVGYTNPAFNIAMFVLRVSSGVLMAVAHGYPKLENFSVQSAKFMHFAGMSGSTSLSLSIFAELVCSIFVVLGLFTRLACIPLLINLAVAVSMVNHYDVFKTAEKGVLFFLIFFTILLLGPGRASIDGLIKK